MIGCVIDLLQKYKGSLSFKVYFTKLWLVVVCIAVVVVVVVVIDDVDDDVATAAAAGSISIFNSSLFR